MNAADSAAKAALERDYGNDWTIARTGSTWWKASRTRRLTDREINKGLSQTLIGDTEPLLRELLAAQAEIQERMATWNPAYL